VRPACCCMLCVHTEFRFQCWCHMLDRSKNHAPSRYAPSKIKGIATLQLTWHKLVQLLLPFAQPWPVLPRTTYRINRCHTRRSLRLRPIKTIDRLKSESLLTSNMKRSKPIKMKLLTTALLAMFAKSITSIPLQQVNDYTYELVSPAPGFTIDVASQLYIIMCQDLNFGPPCDGGYVAPGLCCKSTHYHNSMSNPDLAS